jgi:hypothetical protein
MNGWGHFAWPVFWYRLAWAFAALVLLAAIHVFWVRGRESGVRERLRGARRRFGRGPRLALAAGATGFAACAAWIVYNTCFLNEYLPSDEAFDRQAAYEKTYKPEASRPLPRIVAVEAEVDIYPERRAASIRGTYRLRNRTQAPIDTVLVTLDPRLEIEKLSIEGAEEKDRDAVHGAFHFAFQPPLEASAETTLAYALRIENPGFVDHDSDLRMLGNGTFFDSERSFPHLGYLEGRELEDPNERRRRGLEPIVRMPALEDPAAADRNYVTADADFVRFATTVSTSADQTAIAPGYLRREWRDGDRRYFRYEMDAPILGFWAYLSARYQTRSATWTPPPGALPGSPPEVAIEVGFDPQHAFNVDHMIEAVKDSLDLFSVEFSPYQHRQARILEFPGYRTFAQSFPNTIPYSESLGFIARLKDPDQIDYIYYVTAHEIAHQWWAHQVIGSHCQGSTVLSETLSQYSALLVMERKLGREHMRKFLKHETDRYLRGRGEERVKELPLLRVEDQPYIHYRKGSMVMYALRDAIGEAAVNRALRKLLRDHAFSGPPYPRSSDLLAALVAETPAEKRGLLEDLFETITLWDNRAVAASATPADGGRYRVEVEVDAKKLRAGEQGLETEAPLDDEIDLAVWGSRGAGDPPEGKLLALERRRVVSGRQTLTIEVGEEPKRAAIDPFLKRIDRNPDDNLTGVEVAR